MDTTVGAVSTSGDYEAVKKDIVAILKQPDYDDGSIGPVLVRLAWHASGTYDKATDTGGSAGAGMRYEQEGGDEANNGLQHARVFLEPIKAKHPWITYSDLWTLAGVTAIEAMGGPKIPWKGGRTDFTEKDADKIPPRGRLPDASQAEDHIRAVFGRMGFNDRETVALIGCHTLGRCHTDRSGFDGKWVMSPTRFSNQFFRLLMNLEWKPKTLEGGVQQFAAESLGEELMMLPTDMALVRDPVFRSIVEEYAEDKDVFFRDFSAAFAKLIELGVKRDQQPYIAADKKSDSPGAPDKPNTEADDVKEGNAKRALKAKL